VTFGDPAAVASAIQVGLSVPDGGAEVELLLKTADVKGELQRHVKEVSRRDRLRLACRAGGRRAAGALTWWDVSQGQTGFLASAALQQQDQVDISAARHDFEEADVDSGGTLDQDEVGGSACTRRGCSALRSRIAVDRAPACALIEPALPRWRPCSRRWASRSPTSASRHAYNPHH
jgi:hypothetical protein